jgi:hypothetical protein
MKMLNLLIGLCVPALPPPMRMKAAGLKDGPVIDVSYIRTKRAA